MSEYIRPLLNNFLQQGRIWLHKVKSEIAANGGPASIMTSIIQLIIIISNLFLYPIPIGT